MVLRLTTVVILAAQLAGCAPQPRPASQGTPSPARAPISRGVPAAAKIEGLEIQIAPKPAQGTLDIRVESALPSGNQSWEMRTRKSALAVLSFTDQAGEVPYRLDELSGFVLRAVLSRPPKGAVTARYQLATEAFAVSAPLSPAMDPNQARLSGEMMLLLPHGSDAAPVPVRVSIDPKAFGPDAGVVSTLGLQSTVRGELSNQALRASTFLIGPVGTAEFDAPEGVDRAGWLGYSNFDPRQVAAEVAGFRSGARQYFGSLVSTPNTLLLFSDARKPGQFDVRRRSAGVLVQVGLMQGWDGPLRIAVMQQVMREWIGAQLSVAPADADFPLESAWFLDGFNRTLTRELLFRFGLLTPEEFRDDVEQMLRLYATSPLKQKPLHALKHESAQNAGSILVAKGSLYALLIDGAIRRKSGHKRSLDGVVKALYAEARKSRAPLGPHVFVAAVQKELGEAALELDSGMLRGDSPLWVPVEAMGPCFVIVVRRYERFDLGFVASTDEQGVTLATSVRKDGPAALAGLRDGERISLRSTPEQLGSDVVLDVTRDAKAVRLSYRPSGGFASAQGFERKPKLRDAECSSGR